MSDKTTHTLGVSRQALDEVLEYVSFMEMEQAAWRKFRVNKVNAKLYRQEDENHVERRQ